MARKRAGSDAYYQFRRRVVRVGEMSLTVLSRPALGRGTDTAAGAMLLARHAEVEDGARVLVLHCGDGLVGAAAAAKAPQAHITMADAHAAAVASARQTVRVNGASHVEVMASDCGRAVLDAAPQPFDGVLALLPKGRAVWEQTVLDAAAALRPGGTFYLAGARNCGIRTAGRFVQEVFGEAEVVAYKAGSRLLRAARPARLDLPPSDYYEGREVAAEVAGRRLRFRTRAGLFSRDALDDGTRLLIEALLGPPGGLGRRDRVLDLGCGCGVLTLVAARQAADGWVVGVDADCRAVETARRTLAMNAVANAEAIVSDCVEAVADRRFHAVVTNPPLHQGRSSAPRVAEQFIRDSARVLKATGRLYLVANRFLRYHRVLEEAFDRVEVLRENAGFKVWYGERPRRSPPRRPSGHTPGPRSRQRRRRWS